MKTTTESTGYGVKDKFFTFFYTALITGLTALINYGFNIPYFILIPFNLLIIAIASYKIACLHNLLKK